MFYACNRYAERDVVAWSRPLAEACPNCGSPYLLEKFLKSGHFAECPNKEGKYRKELEPVEMASTPS